MDAVSLAHADGVGRNQFGSDADRGRARLNEVRGGLLVDPAGRDHPDLRQRGFERVDVLISTHRTAGENLDEVGAGHPGVDDLRGRERAGNGGDALGRRELDHAAVQPRRGNELRTRFDAARGGRGIEYRAGADEQARGFLDQSCDQIDRARHGHGDFDDGNAAGRHFMRGEERVLAVGDADGGDNPNLADA